MKKWVYETFFLIIAFIAAGCSRDEIITPGPDTSIMKGAYILCEGSSVPGSAKLSFYNLEQNNFTEDIFNPGSIGLYPSGLVYFQKELYLLEQGNFGSTGRMYLLDSAGKQIYSISAGINPYSLAVTDANIYITNGPSNKVSVYSRYNFNFIADISVGLYPQEILYYNNKVFVCNTGVFGGGTDSTVSVIDVFTNQVTATIHLLQIPSSIAVSNDGNLYIGCPGTHITGRIFKVSPFNYSVLDTFIIGNGQAIGFDKDISVDVNSENIYFISYYNNIVKYNTSLKESSVFIINPNTTENFYYGYKFDSKERKHYVANAKNFQVSGSVSVFDENGNQLNSFTSGIAPRRIVIKN